MGGQGLEGCIEQSWKSIWMELVFSMDVVLKLGIEWELGLADEGGG